MHYLHQFRKHKHHQQFQYSHNKNHLFYLKEIETDALYGKYENTKVTDKIMRMSYDIHIGSIAGIPGKIIAFLISLLSASLPITGILLWYGRKYKKTQVK